MPDLASTSFPTPLAGLSVWKSMGKHRYDIIRYHWTKRTWSIYNWRSIDVSKPIHFPCIDVTPIVVVNWFLPAGLFPSIRYVHLVIHPSHVFHPHLKWLLSVFFFSLGWLHRRWSHVGKQRAFTWLSSKLPRCHAERWGLETTSLLWSGSHNALTRIPLSRLIYWSFWECGQRPSQFVFALEHC